MMKYYRGLITGKEFLKLEIKEAGGALGSFGFGIAGSAAGAAIGAVIFGPAAPVGIAVGAAIGGIIGSLFGQKIGEWCFERQASKYVLNISR